MKNKNSLPHPKGGGFIKVENMKSQKTLKLYVYVDGVHDIPFYGSDKSEYETFVLANGEVFTTSDGFVFNVKSTNEQIEIGSFRYDAKRMGGAPTLTFTLMYDHCLDKFWNDNVYAVFNNERHFLKMTPTSSKTNEDSRYRHEVELVAERKILDNTYFYDAVVGTPQENDKPVTNDTIFNFYGNIEEYAKRINASLQFTKLQSVKGDGSIEGYYVVIDSGISSVDKHISFDGAVLSQALQESYNTFGIPFYFIGKEIHLGFTNNAIGDVLEYGVDDALLSITKQNSNFKVVNRASGKGSTDNIPYYYPNNAPKGEIEAVVNTTSDDFKVSIADHEMFSEKIKIGDRIEYVDNIQAGYDTEDITWTKDFNFSSNKRTYSFFAHYGIKDVDRNRAKKLRITPSINLKFYKEVWFDEGDGETANTWSDWVEQPLTKVNAKIIISIDDKEAYNMPYSPQGMSSFEVLLYKKEEDVIKVKITFEVFQELVEGEGVFYYETYLYKGKLGLTYNISFDEEVESRWIYNDKRVDLGDLGLSYEGVPNIGDTITQRLIKRVKTTTNLQPSIYRATDGNERFYNAINYPFDHVEGYELQYGEYIAEGKVHNDLYKKDDGTYMVFPNPYVEGNPKEHVFSVDELKPTIAEMTNGVYWQDVDEKGNIVNVYQRIDMFSEFAYDEGDNDETYTTEDGQTAFKHPYFFAKLRKLDFNLFDHASEQQEMTFSMTSGNCGACNFKIGVSDDDLQLNPVQVDENGNLIRDEEGRVLCGLEDYQDEVKAQPEQQDTVNYEVWIALKKEEDTYGILMPKAPKYENGELKEAGHRPKSCSSWSANDGDTFVILGINLPEEYIRHAERKLEKKIIQYIGENNGEKFNFSIAFSRIFLEENPKFLEQLNENARLTVKYDGKEYLLYVSSFSYSMGEGEVLPEIRVELDDRLTISQNALQNAIDGVRSEIGQAINSLDVSAIGSRFFLRKDVDDIAEGVIGFRRGLVFGNNSDITVLPDGSAKLTIDYLDVTKKATFTSLEIQEKTHVGGQFLITPASMICSHVEELDNVYRCYFQSKGDDGEEIFNTFAIDDQAICQTFNTWGSKYYWRLVTGVGEDYIDLSKSDCVPESDIPSVGDKIIQLGNRSNIARQAAQVISSYGEDSPSFIMYNGINGFSLNGKEVTGILWNPLTQEPQMFSYGSFFFGDSKLDGNYITFQQAKGETKKSLHINARVTIGKGSGGLSNLSEWKDVEYDINEAKKTAEQAKEVANTVDAANKTLDTKITNIETGVKESVAEINARLDGVVENYFEEGVPSLTTKPVTDWIDASEEDDYELINHVGDTYTNIEEYVDDATTPDAGKSWRWCWCDDSSITDKIEVTDKEGVTRYLHWHPIADSDAVKALLEAYKAQTTADGKSKNFVNQPTPPYKEGDLWIEGPEGDTWRCKDGVNRTSGSFDASDWELASKYTDDTKANEAKDAADNAKATAEDAKAIAQNTKQFADALNSDTVLTEVEKREIRRLMSEITECTDESVTEYNARVVRSAVSGNEWHLVNDKSYAEWYDEDSDEDVKVSQKAWAGYYSSNMHTNDEATVTRLNLTVYKPLNLKVKFGSDAERSYDYLNVGALNTSVVATDNEHSLTDPTMQASTRGRQGITNAMTKTFAFDGSSPSHFIELSYKKDGSESSGTDSGYYRLMNESYMGADGNEYIVEMNGSFHRYYLTLMRNGYTAEATELKTRLNNLMSFLYSNELWESGSSTIDATFRASLNDLVAKYYAYVAEIGFDIAMDRINDAEYLANAMKNGRTIIDGGLVMSSMVAVADTESASDADVEAFLNGSDFASDTTHGKMILAGGIPESVEVDGVVSTDLTERAKQAKTRIYEDGTEYTHKLVLSDGCKIGDDLIIETIKEQIEGGDTEWEEDDVFIESAIIKSTQYDNSYGASFSKAGVKTFGKTYSGRAVTCDITNSCAGYAAFFGISDNEIPYQYCIIRDKPVAVEIDAPDAYAMSINRGQVSGLRPKTRVITTARTSSSPNVITDFDHSVFVNLTSGTCYISLPDAPQDGQEYYIESKGASMNIKVYQPCYSLYSGSTTSAGNAVTQSGRSLLRFKYYADASLWTCSWLNRNN